MVNFISDTQKYYYYASIYSNFNKEEMGKNTLQLLEKVELKIDEALGIKREIVPKEKQEIVQDKTVENKINEEIKKEKEIKEEKEIKGEKENKEEKEENLAKIQEKEEEILPALRKNYIFGKFTNEEKIYEEIIGQKDKDNVTLTCVENEIYLLESKPTGTTNLAFPKEAIKEDEFVISNLNSESTLLNFIHESQQSTYLRNNKKDKKKDKRKNVNALNVDEVIVLQPTKEEDENVKKMFDPNYNSSQNESIQVSNKENEYTIKTEDNEEEIGNKN